MILAIDPGIRGALAFFDADKGTLDIVDMPTVQVMRNRKEKTEISPAMLAVIIAARSPELSVVEKVGARPGEAPSFAFQFGRGVGMVEGVLSALKIPVIYVAPQVWKKAVNAREGKDGNRERAAALYPAYAQMFARKKDDGRADAACMAYWGAMK
jgi:crossover junction endodeoxyribonuclease RuvC